MLDNLKLRLWWNKNGNGTISKGRIKNDWYSKEIKYFSWCWINVF
jgi:hypothetical protein